MYGFAHGGVPQTVSPRAFFAHSANAFADSITHASII
jgi:hypothetical protein